MAMPTWVFDVDGCLVDALTGGSLRPGAVEILQCLSHHGQASVLWSAGGAPYARMRAEQHSIDGWFVGFFGKEQRNERGHYLVDHLVPAGPFVFIDDHPEDLDPCHHLIAVSPYLRDDAHDQGLQVLTSFMPAPAPNRHC